MKIIYQTEALERMIMESNKQIIPISSKYAKIANLSAIETSGFLAWVLMEFEVFTMDGRLIRKLKQINFEEVINPVKSALMKDLKTFITTNHLVWNDIVGAEGRITIKNKMLNNGENRSEIVRFVPIIEEEFSVNNQNFNIAEALYGN